MSEPSGSVDLARPSIKNALISELFGTAILVQVGCGGLCVALYLGTMVRLTALGLVVLHHDGRKRLV